MCWVAVGAIAAVIGTALSVYGSVQAGNAARQSADYNAAAVRNQATATTQAAESQAAATQAEADRRAKAETAQAATDEAIVRDRTRRLQVTARASLGISGQTGEGSAVDLLAENASQAELDALTVRYGGQVRADELRRTGVISANAMRQQAAINASAFGTQADLFSFTGQQRQTAGYLGAGASLLSGVGQFARNFNFSGGSTSAPYYAY